LKRPSLAGSQAPNDSQAGRLDAGHRQIDNNSAERTLRGLAIGRKNWLFELLPKIWARG